MGANEIGHIFTYVIGLQCIAKHLFLYVHGIFRFTDTYSSFCQQAHPIGDWLKGINLSQYLDNFLKNGFDSLPVLKNMSKRDLMEIGIGNVIHIDMMLESLKRISQ